jgi:hypothetical protein
LAVYGTIFQAIRWRRIQAAQQPRGLKLNSALLKEWSILLSGCTMPSVYPQICPSHETATGRKEKHCWSFEIFWRAQPPKQGACHPRLFQPRLCSKELVRHQGANVLSLVSISNTLLAGVDIPLEIMCSLECHTGPILGQPICTTAERQTC